MMIGGVSVNMEVLQRRTCVLNTMCRRAVLADCAGIRITDETKRGRKRNTMMRRSEQNRLGAQAG